MLTSLKKTEGEIAGEVHELVREARMALMQARIVQRPEDQKRLAERAAKLLNPAHAKALAIREGAYPHLADKVSEQLAEACKLAGREHEAHDLSSHRLTAIGRRRFTLKRFVR